jgi:beta-1,4-mannosyltransferase
MASGPVILQSFPAPRATSVNPFNHLLAESIVEQPGVELLYFSWKTALTARYDVFHVHWPEILVEGRTAPRRLVRQLLTLLLLMRLRLRRTPIVRTVHNVELPSGLSWFQHWILARIEAQVTLRIRLNAETQLDPGEPFATIPHGHFRDWFAQFPAQSSHKGRLGYVGRIRRYKGVETLIAAFRELPEKSLRLTVAGYPSSDDLRDTVTSLAGDDPRITLQFGFISDAELVEIVSGSELMVLPYRFMHNSGATIAALSIGRPVLVPANAVNDELAVEVGAGWVFQFEGELTAESLSSALRSVRASTRTARPDLSARDWPPIGAAHVAAYRRAIELVRG